MNTARAENNLTGKEGSGSSFFDDLTNQTLNSLPSAIVVTDLSQKIIYTNQSFHKFIGYTPEEIKGRSLQTFFYAGEDSQIIREIADGNLIETFTGRVSLKKENGDMFYTLLSASFLTGSNKEKIAVVYSLNDLSSELDQDNELKALEDKYRSLFLGLKDAVYESTPAGKLIDINPSGVELFGFSSKAEILRVDIAKDLYANPEDRNKLKKILAKENYIKNYEIEVKTKDGKILTVLETSAAVKDAEGNILCYRGIIRDITESKQREKLLNDYVKRLAGTNEQLIKSEAQLRKINTEKDKFFSIIAHDLKSPFNSLLGLSQFLIEDIEELSKDEIKTFAEEINASSRILFKLLENLLQWAQIQTGRLKQEKIIFDFFETAAQTVMLLSGNAGKKGIELFNRINQASFVYADFTLISSVLQNLVSNAIKFSKKGGKIIIDSMDDGSFLQVSVEDSGIGMSEEALQKIFRIDQHHSTLGTLNEPGTGLGLVLCKELVEKNGGKIWVKSQPQAGTTFFFTIPKPK